MVFNIDNILLLILMWALAKQLIDSIYIYGNV